MRLHKNLVAFLQRCSQRGVKLAVEKLRLSLEEVPLIGHYTTKSGLKVHPEKVQAALEMQRPTDARSLLRFNGTVQYLAKFLLRLSDLSPSSSVDAQERRVGMVGSTRESME